jgi:hypothetical protein
MLQLADISNTPSTGRDRAVRMGAAWRHEPGERCEHQDALVGLHLAAAGATRSPANDVERISDTSDREQEPPVEPICLRGAAPHLAFPSTPKRNSQGVRLGPSSRRIRENCGATVMFIHCLHTHREARSEASGSWHSTISITSSGSSDWDSAPALTFFNNEKHCSAAQRRRPTPRR